MNHHRLIISNFPLFLRCVLALYAISGFVFSPNTFAGDCSAIPESGNNKIIERCDENCQKRKEEMSFKCHQFLTGKEHTDNYFFVISTCCDESIKPKCPCYDNQHEIIVCLVSIAKTLPQHCIRAIETSIPKNILQEIKLSIEKTL